MVKSMTGYGRCKKTIGNRVYTIELKSVNNRFLDCNVKLPRSYIFAEEAVKSYIQKNVSRGKVDVFVTIETIAGDDNSFVQVNEPLAIEYYKAISTLNRILGTKTNVSSIEIARFPDVLVVTKEDENLEDITNEILDVLHEAVSVFQEMRNKEGDRLFKDILSKGNTILNFVEKIEEKNPETVFEYRTRLETKLKEVLESSSIDENRIIQEAAIFADKVAVDEETVRLKSHISQMNNMGNSKEPIGRKLDFLVQEMNRECNTIGSKCNNLEVTSYVVAMKSEVEKIREQVQNIE